MFASVVVGGWLLVFGLKSIKIPLQKTKLFVTGIGFLSAGIIFLVWSVIAYIAYLDELERSPFCYLCPGGSIYGPLYGSSAVIGGFLSSIGTTLLLMHWQRNVLHATVTSEIIAQTTLLRINFVRIIYMMMQRKVGQTKKSSPASYINPSDKCENR
jgi:hypothetical protein